MPTAKEVKLCSAKGSPEEVASLSELAAEDTDGLIRGRKHKWKSPAHDDLESNLSLAQETSFRSRHSLARPVPFEPITDPFAFVCVIARRPKFGHQYVLCPGCSQGTGRRVGLSVGPHWSGVIYLASIIGVITLFLTRFVMKDLSSWHQPVTLMFSFLTLVFLVTTAVVDPGIVVESSEEEPGSAFCEVCSIWTPLMAEHCEECGVCIYGMDHHCPWMGKCVGRGNIMWFRLFNGSWICFLIFVMVSMGLQRDSGEHVSRL